MSDQTLISTRDAAGTDGLEQQPLDTLCATGKIPGAVYRGGRWFLPRTFLEEREALNPRRLSFARFGLALDARP